MDMKNILDLQNAERSRFAMLRQRYETVLERQLAIAIDELTLLKRDELENQIHEAVIVEELPALPV